MLWFLIVILSITLTIFITLYLLSKKSIRDISKEIERIGNGATNSKVRIMLANKEFEMLANNINRILEEKQKREADYKKMDKELRQAIANMSHDLRTPLTSIMGYLQLIEDNLEAGEDHKKYIEIVKTRGSDLKRLIESFYDLSRLQAREYDLKMEKVNLHSILSEQIVAFYNDFTSKNIEPQIYLGEDIPLIIGDENGVRRIFSNLIQNMLRYGSGDIEILLRLDGDSIVTIFKNRVQYLADEDLEHLFDRFYTVDKTRTDKSTGLGLTITRELLHQMGYNITAALDNNHLTMKINWGTVLNKFK